MPHVNGGGSEDLASSDEVKVYKDEGLERESDGSKRDEDLNDDKSELVAIGEDKSTPLPPSYGSPKDTLPLRNQLSPIVSKPSDTLTSHDRPLNMGYIVTPYPYPNGTAGHLPVSMASKVGLPPTHAGSPLSFVMYPNEPFGQPPPAHMGIPPVHIDPKTGIPRTPMYSLPTPSQYPHTMFTPEFAQWHAPGMYPMTTGAGFRGYPSPLVTTASGLPRFSPAGLIPAHPGLAPPHPPIPHQAIVTPGPKQDVPVSSVSTQENHLSYYFLPPLSSTNGMLYNPSYHGNQLSSNPSTPSPDLVYQFTLDLRSLKHGPPQDGRHSSLVDPKGISSNSNESKSSSDSSSHHSHHNHNNHSESKKNKASHIKKPLNAFMLYMKEMRAKVVAECTLKESAAINQILGRRWHALGRDEQAKYYDLARKERQLHMQLYPGWSARDNYAQQGKKKKRKRDKSIDGEGSNPKKCRARFGLDQQSSWCKPCRRKKKCIRYVDGSDGTSVDIDDNLGSVGSSGDIGTPDSKSLMDSDGDAHTSSEISLSSPPVPTDINLDQHKPPSLCVINPHDANHPLSISSLTGQCGSVKREPGPSLTEPSLISSDNNVKTSMSDSVTSNSVPPPAIVSVT